MVDRGVQRMVHLESIVISSLGTVSDMPRGTFTGAAMVLEIDRLPGADIDITLSWIQLLIVLVAEVMFGLIAAWNPGPAIDATRERAGGAQAQVRVRSMSGEAIDSGFPSAEAAQQRYDEADLNRAVDMYRLFFGWVSGKAIWEGNLIAGLVPNHALATMDTKPHHRGLTLNSDTPYGPVCLDLHDGPFVIEVPPGPLLGVLMDLNQRWIFDMGIPGPDAGNGGRHVVLPPDYEGEDPTGFTQVRRAGTFRVLGGLRALPIGGDVVGAIERLRTIVVRPLDAAADSAAMTWLDFTPNAQDTSPGAWETNIAYWEQLHDYIDNEPALDSHRDAYGDLAVLGISKGAPFAPDERMRGLLEQAAVIANGQMRVQAFADRRPDRVVWPDRQWQWAALRYENGDFDLPHAVDVDAREKWLFQAIGCSPAMFRRDEHAGSLYWLGLRDNTGSYLDGSRSYRLTVPLPVPGRLFWSVTVYDAHSRSQIDTDQAKAVISSLHDIDTTEGHVDLHFGPTPPNGDEQRWIRTIPEAGWFVYFRVYGPETAAFDGTWRPGDFEPIN